MLDGVVRTLQWPTTTPAPDDHRSVASRTDDARPAFVDSGPDRAGKAAASERPVLFLGCIARISQQATEAAALHVLLHLGCSVEVVLGQTCCGAIHRHNGFPEQAQGLLEANRRAFGPRTVIGFASACIAELQEHGDLRPVEICRFLADLDWPEEIKLAPLNATVAVHEPCSHRNLLRDQHSVYALLQRIPKLSIRALAGNELCCGAAGTYLIQQPATAIALAEPKIEALRMLRPRYLVTTNTGCALHLGARVREADLDIEVIHPVELIARQLMTQG